ncbi:MAG: alpha-mannosidase, partial [Cyanobacteria bacterium J06631_2]
MVSHNSAVIENAIANLRQLVKLETQASWRDLGESSTADFDSCPFATLNENSYIVFPSGKQIRYLVQRIVIPPTLQGYPLAGLSLRLVLTWWAADAQIFINGELVQQGDLFDSSARVLITNNAQPGQEYLVLIRLVSPGHDIGALMRSHLIYEQDDSKIDPGMVADELTVLCRYLSQFNPANLTILAAELEKFNWDNVQDAAKFDHDLTQLRTSLFPLAADIKQRRFNLLGHAHLDMAWLWTTDETYEVAERTFKSVLDLQQDFPALTFGHTSPALYEWIEQHRPELFKSIQAAAKANKWEILGGMWIEPETNLVCGESLIRQLIYGQAYYQEKFGAVSTVAWLPDSFGFTWQLPQIMQQCGIEYFVTGKLHWNDTTKFPHGCFWWESPDGTRLLTLMSPPNVTGVMDTNPLTMVDYSINWEVQTGLQEIFWLPGVGDHGGGPTRDMLEVAAKWDKSPFFPQIVFGTAGDYLEGIDLGGVAQRRRGAKEETYHKGTTSFKAEREREGLSVS